jgi:hypothetical protein
MTERGSVYSTTEGNCSYLWYSIPIGSDHSLHSKERRDMFQELLRVLPWYLGEATRGQHAASLAHWAVRLRSG